jgi:hypothetical protein
MQKKSVKALNSSNFLLVIGILFIIGSTIIGLVIKCPTQIQCFNIYTLIGVGMACIFFKSAEQSSVSYKSLKFSIKIAGCIAVPILLYIINPIDRIKAHGCDSPQEVSINQPKPPDNKPRAQSISVQCNGLTKKGTRCKHNTSIANGYCFQHQPG